MTRIADKQQQNQAQRKEPEVPVYDQSSEEVKRANEDADETQKDKCEENGSTHKAVEDGELTEQGQQPPLPPTSDDDGEHEGGAIRAREQEEAQQAPQAEERSSTPTAVANKVRASALYNVRWIHSLVDQA